MDLWTSWGRLCNPCVIGQGALLDKATRPPYEVASLMEKALVGPRRPVPSYPHSLEALGKLGTAKGFRKMRKPNSLRLSDSST